MENDQDLYGCPANQDGFGRILLDNNSLVVTNQEKNVALAMTNASKKSSSRLDANIDPTLHDLPANSTEANPNPIGEDDGAGGNDLDALDDDGDLYLQDDNSNV